MDIAMFDRAVQATGGVVTGISPEQMDGPTPCTEWSVRDLLNHLIEQYEAVATGSAGEVLAEEKDYTSEDHVAAYYAASVRARDALAEPGALEKKFAMPWGETPGQMVLGLVIADTAVHGADLAKSTGQEIRVGDDVAEAVHGMTTGMLEPGGKFPRGDSFAEPVEVPADAPIQAKMLAYLGRRPWEGVLVGEPEMTAEQVLAAYEGGERDFSDLRLDGISLSKANLSGVDFEGTSLVGAYLSGADLSRGYFLKADLRGTDFRRGLLFEADLFGATLNDANFRGAELAYASLLYANCIGTDFSETRVDQVVFGGASLTDARFDHAVVSNLCLFDVDISSLCHAQQLTHNGLSYVDARTVMKSYKHPRLKAFMVDCGIPEIFAEYMIDCAKALGDDVLHELMQSTFISYGGPDEAFARRLYDALRAHAVVVFFFPETARVGERIGDEVFNALQRHDRMILVCSRASLDRPGVLNEIQETLDREARDGGATYLVPIILDDYLLTEWGEARPDMAQRVKSRVAADFQGAQDDPAKFDAALGRLLAALKKKDPSVTRPPAPPGL